MLALTRDSGQTRLLVLFPALMAIVALFSISVTILLLYDTSFRQQRERLVATVSSQARLISSIARFNAVGGHGPDSHEVLDATLRQVIDAHEDYKGFGETGEFTLAHRNGANIEFLVRHRHYDRDRPLPVPWDSKDAEPMRRALRGLSGTVLGLDYRGKKVLAAHEPIAETSWGIVAKMDLDEIRSPFLTTALISCGVAVAVIVAGTFLAVRLGMPVVTHLEKSEARIRSILDTAADGIVTFGVDHRIEMFNPTAANLLGYRESEVLGKDVSIVLPETIRHFPSGSDTSTDPSGETQVVGAPVETNAKRKNGTTFPCYLTIGEVRLARQQVFVATIRDLTGWKRAEEVQAGLQSEKRELLLAREELEQKNHDLEQALDELKRTQTDLLQAEKLASVGQLAAGIAHEINTPIQFVGDNVRACADMFEEVKDVVTEYRALAGEVEQKGLWSETIARLRERETEVDLDFLLADVPQALSQSLDGVERVRTIVQAMKNFSHVDKPDTKVAFNLNAAIQSTLTVARNEWKYIADVEVDLADDPLIVGFPSELNQVFLNLLINAAHAIQDKGTDEKGTISIRTRQEDDWVVVSIGDTGCGMPERVRRKIFDPFFTTKEVGRGTGQGLAISYSIIVERHRGRIEVETEEGVGTTFHVWLPRTAPLEDARLEEEQTCSAPR